MSIVVTILETSKGYFLKADKNGVNVFETMKKGLQHYEDIYNEWHNRNYEASMSATIFWMQFQPSLLEFEDFDTATKVLLPNHREGNKVAIRTMRSVAGYATGIKLDIEGLKALWNSGKQPRLISEDTFERKDNKE